MFVKYYQTGSFWKWAVYDKSGKAFCISCRSYSRRSDAVRAFQKLDRLF